MSDVKSTTDKEVHAIVEKVVNAVHDKVVVALACIVIHEDGYHQLMMQVPCNQVAAMNLAVDRVKKEIMDSNAGINWVRR